MNVDKLSGHAGGWRHQVCRAIEKKHKPGGALGSWRGKRTAAVQRKEVTTTPLALNSIHQWMEQEFRPAQITVQESSPGSFRYQVEQGSPSPTLHVPKDVLDAHPVDDIITALNHDHVAARLRSDPVAQLMCVASPEGIGVVRYHWWRRGR